MESVVYKPTLVMFVDNYTNIYKNDNISQAESQGIINYACLLIAFCLIIPVGLIGNVTVLCTIALDRLLRSPTNMFIISIAISDFAMTVFPVPLAFASAIHRQWLFGYSVCKM